MPFQSRQFSPARITRMPLCPSTMAASAQLVSWRIGELVNSPILEFTNSELPVSDGAQSSHEVNQQDGADGGHDELADDAARVQSEQPEQRAPENRAHNPEQQIHEHPVAAAAHDLAGQKAGQNPDDDLVDQIHNFTTPAI